VSSGSLLLPGLHPRSLPMHNQVFGSSLTHGLPRKMPSCGPTGEGGPSRVALENGPFEGKEVSKADGCEEQPPEVPGADAEAVPIRSMVDKWMSPSRKPLDLQTEVANGVERKSGRISKMPELVITLSPAAQRPAPVKATVGTLPVQAQGGEGKGSNPWPKEPVGSAFRWPPPPSGPAPPPTLEQFRHADIDALLTLDLWEVKIKTTVVILAQDPQALGTCPIGEIGHKDSGVLHASYRWAESLGKSTKRGTLIRALLSINEVKEIFWIDRGPLDTNPKVGLMPVDLPTAVSEAGKTGLVFQ
jgi:hypothetical protein